MAKFLEYRKYGLGVDAPVEYIFASCKNFAVAKKYDLHCKCTVETGTSVKKYKSYK